MTTQACFSGGDAFPFDVPAWEDEHRRVASQCARQHLGPRDAETAKFVADLKQAVRHAGEHGIRL